MARQQPAGPSNKEQALIETILSFKYDPLGFVLYAFPWGVRNTPLANFEGPRQWQRDLFEHIGAQMQANILLKEQGLPTKVIYIAISSGRGIGKSAFLSMLSTWFMSCWLGGTNIITANTELQLRSRTMAEVGKWSGMLINRHWFEKTALTLRPNKWFAQLLNSQLDMDTQYFYSEAQTWSSENPDAFAGAHSQVGMMVQFDEASGIDDSIWPVTDGFFTDLAELRLWVAISNPRRNTGQFFECFHKNEDRWYHKYVDSRSVEGVDKAVYQRIADQYGEDHDVTRVEVKGRFPRTGSNQFIGRSTVEDAQVRDLVPDSGSALIMGVDVARYGDDESVIRFRCGRDARTIPRVGYKGINTMELAERVADLIDRYKPDACMVDGGGVGGGVVDRLQMLGYHVSEVQSGAKADEAEEYLNKRVEMWARMRDWLVIGAIDGSSDLAADLTAPEYEVDLRNRMKLETKDSMKKRGLPSPDDGDALALTFAHPVARRDTNTSRRGRMRGRTAVAEYDVFES